MGLAFRQLSCINKHEMGNLRKWKWFWVLVERKLGLGGSSLLHYSVFHGKTLLGACLMLLVWPPPPPCSLSSDRQEL